MQGKATSKVVYAALAANVAIALTKLGASFFTGSSAMFTESIHSFVDSGDQLLLLYGLHRAARPADDAHPFGHGLELYFWSFVVSLLIFTLGGVLAIYEGIEKIRDPEPIASAWVNFTVIGLAFLFEGYSFQLAWRELVPSDTDGSAWSAMRRSKDPSTFIVVLEDGAALMGLAIALCGVGASVWFGVATADGIASVGIGLLLIGVAVILARETRSLLTGESASRALVQQVRQHLEATGDVAQICDLRSLQLGSDSVLIAATLRLREDLPADRKLQILSDLRQDLRAHLSAITYVYLGAET